MPGKQDVWVLPRLRRRGVAAFLRTLAPHFALASRVDLRLRLDAEGNLIAMYPVPAAPADPRPLHGHLSTAFVAAGRSASEIDNMIAQSRDLSDALPLLDGVLGWIWLQSDALRMEEDPQPETRLRAVIDVGATAEAATSAFAALVRRSRDARFVSGGAFTLLDLEDNPERGATLDALRASGLPGGGILLAKHSLAGLSLWLPEGKRFTAEVQPEISTLLLGLTDSALLVTGSALHLLPEDTGGCRVIVLPPDAPDPATAAPVLTEVEELAAAIAPAPEPDELGPPLRFSVLSLCPDAEAQQALNIRLNDRRFPMGYRISLAFTDQVSRSDEDIERLRAEIEEREARIALIQALGRAQLRLLRFTDAQLPALVDGLRKMPRALREDAGLLYAATHAAGRPEPVHYVLYDPDRVQFDGRLPEIYWRAETEDQPIAFWLDPHAENARDENSDEARIFVPQSMQILPNMDSFGGRLTGTLQLVLGNLFADASTVLAAQGAQPAFVFSTLGPGGAGRDEIGADLIDLSRFQPLKVSLRWINDHILASSPRIADAADRQELAESLYAGQLAAEIRQRMAGEVLALREDWAQAQAELLGCFDQMVDAVTRQVSIQRTHLEGARTFVDLAKARLAEVTQALNGLGAAVGGIDTDLEAMAFDIPSLAASRIAFFDRYQTEYEAGEQALLQTKTEIAQLRTRMEILLAELRQR